MTSTEPEIHVSIWAETDEVLTVEEVWPDGDAPPDVITAEVVLEQMKRSSGTKRRLLDDWSLFDPEAFEIQVTVTQPNPHYVAGVDPFFPDLAPEKTLRSSVKWDG